MYKEYYIYQENIESPIFWIISQYDNYYLLETKDLYNHISSEKIYFNPTNHIEKNSILNKQTQEKIIKGYRRTDDENIKDYQDIRSTQNILKELGFNKSVWIPITKDIENNYISSFSGNALLYDDEDYPKCRYCDNNLELILQLSFEELPKNLRFIEKGILQVFLCIGNCLGETYFNNDSGFHIVRILNDTESIHESNIKQVFPTKTIFEWKNIGDDYPEVLYIDEISSDIKNKLPESYIFIDNFYFDFFNYKGEKIGGYPSFCQDPIEPDCPICDEKMTHIIQISSEINIPYMFGDGGYAHVFACKKHLDQTTLYWDCS